MSGGEVAFVVVSWNSRERVGGAVGSAARQGARVIVVDNGSQDGTPEHVGATYPDAMLIDARANLGFPAAANLGIAEALADPACRFVGLLNDDAWLGDGWLAAILAFAAGHPEGAGFQGLTLDGTDPSVVDSVGLTIGHAGRAIQLGYRQRGPRPGTGEVFGVNAAAALYRRAFLEAQPFGEVLDAGLQMYLEDVDLAARAELLGWRNFFVEGAVAYHLGSGGGRDRRPRTVRLNSRNEILVLVKNLPWGLVARTVPGMVHAELARDRDYVRARDRRALVAALQGRLAALAALPAYLRKRAVLKPYRVTPPQALWDRMGMDLPQPPTPPPARPPRGSLREESPPAPATLAAEIRAVVVHYNTAALAAACVASLVAEGVVAVMVVDNASAPAEWAELQRRCAAVRGVTLLRQEENRGYGAGVNAGVAALGREYQGLIWVVNPDMAADPGAAVDLAAAVTSGALDVACPAIYAGGGDRRTVYFTGGTLNVDRVEADHWDFGLPFIPERGVVACSYAAGASFLLARSTWDLVGGLPEDLFLYWEDAALSFRAAALGLRIGTVRQARMWHAVGASTSAARETARATSRATYYYTCRNRFLVSQAWGVSLRDLLAGPAAGATYRWPLRALLRERTDRWGRTGAALQGTLDGALRRARPGCQRPAPAWVSR